MKYIANHQYAITYKYNCNKINSQVDITTTGVKSMTLGCHTAKIKLGKSSHCTGMSYCNSINKCACIDDARKNTVSELLK